MCRSLWALGRRRPQSAAERLQAGALVHFLTTLQSTLVVFQGLISLGPLAITTCMTKPPVADIIQSFTVFNTAGAAADTILDFKAGQAAGAYPGAGVFAVVIFLVIQALMSRPITGH